MPVKNILVQFIQANRSVCEEQREDDDAQGK